MSKTKVKVCLWAHADFDCEMELDTSRPISLENMIRLLEKQLGTNDLTIVPKEWELDDIMIFDEKDLLNF